MAEGYYQDFININSAKNIEEIKKAINSSPTDMYEVYPHIETDLKENIPEFKFEYVKAYLMTYPLFNLAYHSFEGIEWEESLLDIAESSIFNKLEESSKTIQESISNVLRNWEFDFAVEQLQESGFIAIPYFNDINKTNDVLGAISDLVNQYMRGWKVIFDKVSDDNKLEVLWSEITKNHLNDKEFMKEEELFIEGFHKKGISKKQDLDYIESLGNDFYKKQMEYIQLYKVKNIKELTDELSKIGCQYKTEEQFKELLEKENIKSSFKNIKVYALAFVLRDMIFPLESSLTKIKNNHFHPNEKSYFKYVKALGVVTKKIIELLSSKEKNNLEEIKLLAETVGFSYSLPNSKSYVWNVIDENIKDSKGNQQKIPDGVDLLLNCLSPQALFLMSIAINFKKKIFINHYY